MLLVVEDQLGVDGGNGHEHVDPRSLRAQQLLPHLEREGERETMLETGRERQRERERQRHRERDYVGDGDRETLSFYTSYAIIIFYIVIFSSFMYILCTFA